MRSLTVSLCLTATMCTLGTCQPLVAASELQEKLNLGDYWYGPELSKEDLKGKVVLFVEARTLT